MMGNVRDDDETTLASLGRAQLARLARVCGLEDRVEELETCLVDLLGPHGDTDRSSPIRWRSDVCDDHTPYEYSLAIGRDTTELRLLVETVGQQPTLIDAQVAGAEASRRLANSLGVSLERLRAVEPLFHSEAPQGLFARWHAVEFARGKPTRGKVYLNPLIHGAEDPSPVIEQALERLGMGPMWTAVQAARRKGGVDELKYFSLDLADSREARVKVYLRHHAIHPKEFEKVLENCTGYQPGLISSFCRALSGDAERLSARPVFSCLAGTSGQPGVTATIYVPMSAFAPNDAVARDRTSKYLRTLGLPVEPFEQSLAALARGPLESSRGLISYVSTKLRADQPRMTIYLSPEAYSNGPS